MKIVLYPDPRLRTHNRPLFKNEFGRELKRKAAEMITLMEENDGVGLAAPQVGINQRFFVAQHGLLPHNVIVNPHWEPDPLASSYEAAEGCLSFPGVEIQCQRFDKILVRYQCARGTIWSTSISGFAAHVFQHEADHLNGKLFIDKFSKVRKVSENEVR